MVQAVPLIEDCEYIGMPLFKELGPLSLDPQVEKKALTRMQVESYAFPVKRLFKPSDSEPVQFQEGKVVFYSKLRELRYEVTKEGQETQIPYKCQYSDTYPSIELNPEMYQHFELSFSQEEVIKCMIEDPAERDILALSIRTCEKIQFNEQVDIFNLY